MICGGRAGPETMRRGPGGVAAGGVNARLRLSGPFVSPPPDWTSQIRGRWNTIRRRGRLYRNLPPPPPPPQTLLPRARALARLFSVRNELWSRGGPIGCSTPLCTTGPVQTGLSRSVKAERSQGACLHDRCLDTKNSSTTGKGTTRRGLFDGNLYTRPRFPWKRKEDDTCKISRWIDREEGKRNGRNGRETCF